ncbi:hypothetical protein PV325_007630 [Microctonus aethiopoides]|nr:hypothetical protein PV325_007630 [Microctonus aethiopoides]KAK0095254.1 hypothetical protein PV326_008854 [Microctonus aethiopoides]
MISLKNLFIVFSCSVSLIIISTTAQNIIASLVREKIASISSYGDTVSKIIRTANNDIYKLGNLIAKLKRNNSVIKKLENHQQEIINKTECLWKSGKSGKKSFMFRQIITKMDSHYKTFENYFLNSKTLDSNFTKFIDLIIANYIYSEFLNSYVMLIDRRSTSQHNSLFDVLVNDFDPKKNCNVQSIDELFADMAALYSLVFTKQYTMVLLSLKATEVPELRREMNSINILNLYHVKGYLNLFAEVQKYYKRAINITNKSIIKAFRMKFAS